MSAETDIRNSLHLRLYDSAADMITVVKIAMHHAIAYRTADPLEIAEVADLALRMKGNAFSVGRVIERIQSLEQAAVRREDQIEQARRAAVGRVVEQGLNDRFDPHGYFVYLLWGDREDVPLYVGQSKNVLARLGSHLGQREKRSLTRRVQIIRCANRSAMDKTESALIRRYQPPLNVIGVGQRSQPGTGVQVQQIKRAS